MKTHLLEGKASLSMIRRLIRADLSSAGMDPSLTFDCLVAVTEACTNALMHGKMQPRGPVLPEVGWVIEDDRARFYVQDHSAEQWSSKVAHPSRFTLTALDEERIGGFGLELMRELMDRVDINVSSRGTTVELVKYLRAAVKS